MQAAQRKAQEEAEARRKAEEDRKTALRAQQLKACHSPPLDLTSGVPGWLANSLLWCMWLRGIPGCAQLLVCERPVASGACSNSGSTHTVSCILNDNLGPLALCSCEGARTPWISAMHAEAAVTPSSQRPPLLADAGSGSPAARIVLPAVPQLFPGGQLLRQLLPGAAPAQASPPTLTGRHTLRLAAVGACGRSGAAHPAQGYQAGGPLLQLWVHVGAMWAAGSRPCTP